MAFALGISALVRFAMPRTGETVLEIGAFSPHDSAIRGNYDDRSKSPMRY